MEGVRKDGVLVSARKILNFIQGNGMTITIADSGSGQNVIDITLESTGGAGGAPSGPAGGELAGTYPNPTVGASHSGSTHAAVQAAAEATAAADVVTHEGLADPHTGYRLESADHSHASTGIQGGTVAHGVLTGLTATDHHAAPAAGPDADVTVDTAGAAGTASTFARSGHGHKVATSASAAAAVGTAAAGTSGTAPSRGDHVHATGAGTPSTQAMGDAAATGTGPAAAMTDHKHAMPALGTTAAAIGTSAGGAAVTPSKSDHVHATGAGTPSTQAFGDAAAVGSGPAASMTDHKHAMPAAPTAASVGAAATSHTHIEGDVTSLISDLAAKAASVHTHAESDVTSLVADLATLTAALALKVASADLQTNVDRAELRVMADINLPGTSELSWVTPEDWNLQGSYQPDPITIPNNYYRLHYLDLQLYNDLTMEGTGELVLFDFLPHGDLTLA